MRRYVRAEDYREHYFARKEKVRQRRAEDLKNKVSQIQNADKPIEEAFEMLVPSSGPADTKAGELVRAMMRIMYRDYNDGDLFYSGYGVETCGEAVAYICDKIPDLEKDFENIAMRCLEGNNYTKAIEAISDKLLDHIYDNSNLLRETNNENMFDWDGEDFLEEREWIPRYTVDCDMPDNVYAHLRAGNISESELESEMEYWDYMKDAEIYVDPNDSYVEVSNLKKDAYDEIDASLFRWLEMYGEDLDEEYGVPGEEEEEEEDEE